MTTRSPNTHSDRMPLVMLAIGRADMVRTPWRVFSPEEESPSISQVFTSVLRGLRDTLDFVPINSWDAIVEFSYETNTDRASYATFKLFDPFFDKYLAYLGSVRGQQDEYSIYYRFGWIEGGVVNFSPVYEGVIVDEIDAEMQHEGAIITFRVQQRLTFERTQTPVVASFDPGIPGHLIVQALIEFAGQKPLTPTDTKLTQVTFLKEQLESQNKNPSRIPRVDIGVVCEPIENNGQPLVCPAGENPLAFLRSKVLPVCVPADPALKAKHARVKLFESETQPGVYVLTTQGVMPEGDTSKPVAIRRTYHVSRGQAGQVLSFTPKDLSAIANKLAGGGVVVAVDAKAPRGRQAVSSAKGDVTGDPQQGELAQSIGAFYRFSSARTFKTIVQQRYVSFAAASELAASAEAEIIGDPSIQLNDYLEFNVYAGGTISTAGRYEDTVSERSDTPVLLPYISGTYVVTGYTHSISAGQFRTQLTLVKSYTDDGSVIRQPEAGTDVDGDGNPTVATSAASVTAPSTNEREIPVIRRRGPQIRE